MSSAVVHVATNTMLADLDESLRTLLSQGLERHGFGSVDVEFDAPNREWSGQLSAPTLNLFLYDLRESGEHRRREIDERRGAGGAFESRPPLVLECSYALTAWTKSVEDEHRLLSQALGILYAFPRLPEDVQPARLRDGSQRYPIITRVGQARGEGKSDFWSAVGGQYKASIDLVVTLTCEPGVAHARGPEVRGTTIKVSDSAVPGKVTELHRLAGRLLDEHGAPQAGAWVALPDTGRFTSTDGGGMFRFDRVPAGTHRCVARTAQGHEAETELAAPGGAVDLVATAATKTSQTTKRKGRA